MIFPDAYLPSHLDPTLLSRPRKKMTKFSPEGQNKPKTILTLYRDLPIDTTVSQFHINRQYL
jgi:hypothetical protein